jgi:hypothetical protein
LYVTSCEKRRFVGGIKVKNLDVGKNVLQYPGRPSLVTVILKRWETFSPLWPEGNVMRDEGGMAGEKGSLQRVERTH